MADRIQTIVAELPALDRVTEICGTADRRLAAGDDAFVADLGLALVRASARESDRAPWQYGSVFDHLVRLLARTPGPENVAQLLRLVAAAGAGRSTRPPYLAWLLASGQRPEDLAQVCTRHASEELRACLVQELVLRGVEVGAVPAIARWAASAHGRGHPLARLPLTLLEVERKPDLPHPPPFGPPSRSAGKAHGSGRIPAFAETTTEVEAETMAAAFAAWRDESNGKVEARSFRLREPLRSAAVPDLLAGLGPDCLDGLDAARIFSVTPVPPQYAWRLVSAAASAGGAYPGGRFGAYGRLAAWQSLAGLVAAPPEAPHEAVDERVRAWAWYAFEGDMDWFEQVAWDAGLAGVSPDGRLAVLAVTDTD